MQQWVRSASAVNHKPTERECVALSVVGIHLSTCAVLRRIFQV